MYASKNITVCREVQTHFGSSPLARITEKVLGDISRFMRAKTKLFAVKLRRILEVLRLQGLQKKFWVVFHDLCVQKRSYLPYSSDAFGSSPLVRFAGKVLGGMSRFMRAKTKLFAVKVRRILEVFSVQAL